MSIRSFKVTMLSGIRKFCDYHLPGHRPYAIGSTHFA